jgi:uncharacterized membrane protein
MHGVFGDRRLCAMPSAAFAALSAVFGKQGVASIDADVATLIAGRAA